jgi:hypothetical protein
MIFPPSSLLGVKRRVIESVVDEPYSGAAGRAGIEAATK